MFLINSYTPLGGTAETETSPCPAEQFERISITNGKYYSVFAASDPEKETGAWDYSTLFSSEFDGTLRAGNVDFLASEITHMRLKRRKTGEFDYMALAQYEINEPDDLDIVFDDKLVRNNTEYEYVLVPIVETVEGAYSQAMTAKETACFANIYLLDADNVYSFAAEPEYGAWEVVRQVGEFTTGAKYPVIIEDGDTAYIRGTFKAMMLRPETLEQQGSLTIDRKAERIYRDKVIDFLLGKKPKILKDWNGEIRLIRLTSDLSVEWRSEYGHALADVSFSFSEIGDAEEQTDLYNAGMLPVGTEGE